MSDAQKLPDRLRGYKETSVQHFELAATDRLNDAMTLLPAGRWLGAIYLLGYVAEIYLKAAVYRRLRAPPYALERVFFQSAKAGAEKLGLWTRKGWKGGHGLTLWAHLLWSLPDARGRTLGVRKRHKLYRCVRGIEDRWIVDMRYSTDPSSRAEAEAVLASVEWIRKNRSALWS